MDNTFDLLLAAGSLVLAVLFRMGIGADWVLGKTAEDRARYREEPTMRYFSTLLFVLSGCSWLSVLGGVLQNRILIMTGVVLGILVVVGGAVYFMRSGRFRA